MGMDINKQLEHIKNYKEIRADYVAFAELLEEILRKAAEAFGYLALVESRAKTVKSFTGKIIKKGKYNDPLKEMTDLCGGRIILHYQSQVKKMCAFIEDNFEIDKANSHNAKTALNFNEFGYRSVHYIVTPKKDSILGIPVDKKFHNLKAEVQVRTLAEHVWADISHDRIYKTDLLISDEWKRNVARLSAILEDVDNDFSQLACQIDTIASVNEIQYLSGKKTENEIDKLENLIKVQQNLPDECVEFVLRLSSIYKFQDNFGASLDLLKPWLKKKISPNCKMKIQYEYGLVLMLKNWENPVSSEYINGQKYIEESIDYFEKNNQSELNCFDEILSYYCYKYAKLLQRNKTEYDKMHHYFSLAYKKMPENPLYIVALIESSVLTNTSLIKGNAGLFHSALKQAAPKLTELLLLGVRRVPVLLALAHCYFFKLNNTACIGAYASLIDTFLNKKYLNGKSNIKAEIELMKKLSAYDNKTNIQIQLFLNMAMYLSEKGEDKKPYMKEIKKHSIRKEDFKEKVLIIAGGASKMSAAKAETYHPYIKELMYGFEGTVISGGTMAGIPGLVGKVKNELQKNKKCRFDLLAYLPEKLPGDAVISKAYDRHYRTPAAEFSAMDVLVCWTDLLNKGINPKDVILVGIDGGQIAIMEYSIALALGATVALVASSDRAVTEFLNNKMWAGHPRLLHLPDDPLTLWALVKQTAKYSLYDTEVEKLAKKVHTYYSKERLKEIKDGTTDINKYKVVMPWKNLEPSLRNSNLKQVAFYEHMLERVGLGIRKSDNPIIINIKDTLKERAHDYHFLASLEHARWNAERLLDGWKYGDKKDIAQKINPCIKPWDELDDETKGYDYTPIDNIPKLLKMIGYEVYVIK